MLYNENYTSLPMGHEIGRAAGEPGRIESVSYSWTFAGRRHRLSLSPGCEPRSLTPGSEEEFIAEHYWGYSRQRDGGTSEYPRVGFHGRGLRGRRRPRDSSGRLRLREPRHGRPRISVTEEGHP